MPSTTSEISARDGSRLALRRWATTGVPAAVVLIVHGLGEHAGRYEHVGSALAAAGFAAVSYDQRGFGASDGRRAFLDRWETVHDDLEDVVRLVRADWHDCPLALYGHSLGATISLGYMFPAKPRPRPDLLVMTGPAIDDSLARWKHAIAPIVARVLPGLMISNGIGTGQLAAVPRPGLRYREDPLVLWKSSVRYGALGFAEQARLRAVLAPLARMPVPTLVARGADDPIVPLRSFERLAGLGNVTARGWPGLRHEIHNEASWEAVIDEVVAWLRERITGLDGPVDGRPGVHSAPQQKMPPGSATRAESVARPQTRGT